MSEQPPERQPPPPDSPGARLREIVAARDLKALERFCGGRTHQKVHAIAAGAGIDRDELEDLLYQL